MSRAVLVGCSGWSYQHWRGPVYEGRPNGQWLGQYARMFPTVEVNASFYRLPSAGMVQGWADRSPPRFVFAVKVSRYLTHVRRLRDVADGVCRLTDRMRPLHEAGKLGPYLWQLPETFHRDDDRLAEAIAAMPPGRNAFEFRHPSWFCRPVCEMLSEAGVALVVGDHPKRRFQTLEPTTDWMYVRFHHGARGVRGNYSPAELESWAERIRCWRRRGDVYAYFNNDWEAFAVRNAQRLQQLVGASSAHGVDRQSA
jgi:uncharacterized protein YecE (DUF72 family)